MNDEDVEICKQLHNEVTCSLECRNCLEVNCSYSDYYEGEEDE